MTDFIVMAFATIAAASCGWALGWAHGVDYLLGVLRLRGGPTRAARKLAYLQRKAERKAEQKRDEEYLRQYLEAAGYSFVCGRCARSDHSSHDDHEGLGGLDMLDCKNVNADGSEQCMCRATWPRNERERGD